MNKKKSKNDEQFHVGMYLSARNQYLSTLEVTISYNYLELVKWGHSSKGHILLYLIEESKQQCPKCPKLDILYITS